MSRIGRAWLSLLLVVAITIAACAPSKPDLTDPREILAGAVTQIEGASTVRLKLDVTGAIALDLLGSGSARPMLLEGTTLTSDLDIRGGRFKATFAAPALVGLTGDFIAPGGRAYLKTSLTGPKYVPLDPEVEPAPGASPGPLSLAALTALLEDPSVTATKLDDADCGDGRCYQVQVEVDPAAIDLGLPDLGALSGLFGLEGLAPGSGTPPIDPIVIVIIVAKDSLRPVTIASDIALGDTATLELLLTFSAWGDAVSIEAPPDDQVGQPGDLGGFPFPFPGLTP